MQADKYQLPTASCFLDEFSAFYETTCYTTHKKLEQNDIVHWCPFEMWSVSLYEINVCVCILCSLNDSQNFQTALFYVYG